MGFFILSLWPRKRLRRRKRDWNCRFARFCQEIFLLCRRCSSHRRWRFAFSRSERYVLRKSWSRPWNSYHHRRFFSKLWQQRPQEWMLRCDSLSSVQLRGHDSNWYICNIRLGKSNGFPWRCRTVAHGLTMITNTEKDEIAMFWHNYLNILSKAAI